MKLFHFFLSTILGILIAQSTMAQTQNLFHNKTLKMIVPYAPGGSYDLYARVVAEHMRVHVPGAAGLIVQNMPGAGGMVAVQNIYSREPQDGTSLAIMPREIVTNQLLRPEAAKYESRKFGWVGSVCAYSGVLYLASRVNVRSVGDLRSREIIIGSWGQGTDSFNTPKVLNAVAGTKFRVVVGYSGGPEIDIAVERGEADGRVASWTFLKTQKPSWLQSDFISVPFQTGLMRHPELPSIPLITELAQDDDGKQILQIMNADSGIGWSFATAPGVPPDALSVLRKAFDATMADRSFRADAEKRGLEVLPSTGPEIAQLVNATLGTSDAVVQKLRSILDLPK